MSKNVNADLTDSHDKTRVWYGCDMGVTAAFTGSHDNTRFWYGCDNGMTKSVYQMYGKKWYANLLLLMACSRTTCYRIRRDRKEGEMEQETLEQHTDDTKRMEDDDQMTLASFAISELEMSLEFQTEEAEESCPYSDHTSEWESLTSDEEDSDTAPIEQCLFDGSQVTLTASSLLVMEYAIKHHLSNEALSYLLKILKFLLPAPNNAIGSGYIFKKQFKDSTAYVVFHYFCLTNINKTDVMCPNDQRTVIYLAMIVDPFLFFFIFYMSVPKEKMRQKGNY